MKYPQFDNDKNNAKAYDELGNTKAELKQLLKSSVSCEVMKNQPSNCRFSTDDITSQGLYYLNIIQKESLFRPVSELCPRVCEHWVNIARNKAAEMMSLQKIKLPDRKEENKAQLDCDRIFFSGEPPMDTRTNKKWRDCQTPVVCKSIN